MNGKILQRSVFSTEVLPGARHDTFLAFSTLYAHNKVLEFGALHVYDKVLEFGALHIYDKGLESLVECPRCLVLHTKASVVFGASWKS